jgi:hypothetical protein
LIDNKDSKKRYRADQLIEGAMEKVEAKIEKEITKARKRFGDGFDEAMFRQTNDRVKRNQEKYDYIKNRLAEVMTNNDLEGMKALIEELEITDPESGSKNWTDVRQFNLMFSTQLGNIAGEAGKLYLRPETAQGIFVNFLNVQKTHPPKTALRNCPDWQSLPKRDCGPTVHLPDAGIRADGNAVLYSTWLRNGVVRILERATHEVAPCTRYASGKTSLPRSR